MSQQERYIWLTNKRVELSKLMQEYWQEYSNIDSWQFWTNFILLIVPLLLLFKFLDRKRLFEIGFFGFAVHTVASYIDIYGIKEGLWGYPFQLSTYIAANLAVDASLIPVAFMFIYQYTFYRPMLFYVSAFLGCTIFSYIIKPFLARLNLFWLGDNMSFSKLLLYYIACIVIATIIVKVFHHAKNKKDYTPY